MHGENVLAERLRLVRQARGLSQEELSEAMNRLVSKQAISKYEKGEDAPSARVLLALAEALRVPSSRLLEEDEIEITTVAFRKKSALRARERDRLAALLTCHLRDAVRVRNLVAPGECFDLPVRSLDVRNLDDAESQADKLRSQWGLGDEPISTVVDVLEEQGVSVCMVEADGQFDGLSAVARNKKGEACGAAVLCRDGLTRERQRLNLAHELAHVVLNPGSSVDEEDAAWRFAGAFLAPKEKLLSDVGELRRSISLDEMILLKKRYGISIQAMLMRLKNIGVLSEETTKQAFIQLTRMRMRATEPGDTKDMESPQWFRRTVLRAVSEGCLDSREATELLGEEVRPVERKRNQFVRLLASMTPEERQPFMETTEGDEDLDREWLDSTLIDSKEMDEPA